MGFTGLKEMLWFKIQMKPDKKYIKISNNENNIKRLIKELIVEPRLKAIEWAKITKQTPNLRVGYPGQHIASLVTGVEGERTAARGHDLADGSEAKSCSRIDQLDECLKCKEKVARIENNCSKCGSSEIDRKNDSKWLFTIKNTDDLDTLVNKVPRIVLLLGDYPYFDQSDFKTLRFTVYEIWPSSSRNRFFSQLMGTYLNEIYNVHKRKTPNKSPAPKNFWPFSYQFYMCNPIKTFEAYVENSTNEDFKIRIDQLLSPETDRAFVASINMPISVLKSDEIDYFLKKVPPYVLKKEYEISGEIKTDDVIKRIKNKGITENCKNYLAVRSDVRTSTAKVGYRRKDF
jgi:hypothetical protein